MSEEQVQTTVRYSDSIVELTKALIAAQSNYGTIIKNKYNPHTKSYYADLADVIAATLPALSAQGLTIIQPCVVRGRTAGTSARLAHVSGEFIENEVLLPVGMPGRDDKFDSQSVGGAFTYARRYSWQGLSGAVSESDDDGNAASGRGEPSSDTEQPRRVPKPPQVNSAPAKVGGRKPNEGSKPSQDGPANAQGSDSSPIPRAEIPGLPSAEDLDAVAKEREVQLKTAESTTSSVPQTEQKADIGEKPTKTQFDGFVKRAQELKQPLEKAGLKAGKGVTTGQKIKNHLLTSFQAKELTDLTAPQWKQWLETMELYSQNEPGKAVELIEGGK